MIKISSRFIFAVLAAIVVLASSCTKEIPVGQDSDPKAPAAEGSRVIAVSFAPQTKTALEEDGLTPYFELGDEILLCAEPSESNTEPQTETCKVKYNDRGKAYITTNLEGDLYAIYPKTAVKKFINDKSGEEKETLGVYVPSVQSGKFSDANILTGGISKKTNEVILEPYSALLRFYVDKSIGVKSIKVIGTTMRINDEEGNSSSITTVTAPEGKTLDEVTDDPNGRLCYVAVPDDINITGVSFEIETTSQGVVKKTTKATGKFSDGKIYNVFIPYYVKVNVGTQYQPEYQKWAYCNIGALLPEDPGYFFSWGNTVGYVCDGTNWAVAPGYEQAGTVLEGGFSDGNYSVSTGYNLDEDIPVNATYDAALAYWGKGWRIPTQSEFERLLPFAGSEEKRNNVNGLKFNTSPSLFFPTFGYGDTEPMEEDCHYGNYWSSTLYSSAHDFAMFFELFNGEAGINDGNRSYGYSVRPIYDKSVPDGALPGVFSVGPNEEDKVHFSKGNLYCDNSNPSAPIWGFEEKQYYFRTIAGKGKCDASGYSINTGTLSNHWGLFGWSSENDDNYGMNLSDDYKDYSGEFKDWGENIGDGNNWRTMSIDEWIYLLKTRKASTINGVSNARYMFCRIKIDDSNSVPGMLVFSDDFSWPTGNAPSESAATTINGNYGSYTEYEIAEFESLESAGAVFLPEAGNRKSGTEIEEVDIYGGYRSSTAIDEHYARYLSFYRTVVDMTYMTDSRHFSRSVRLVTNVK